jgi:hypothetical protein
MFLSVSHVRLAAELYAHSDRSPRDVFARLSATDAHSGSAGPSTVSSSSMHDGGASAATGHLTYYLRLVLDNPSPLGLEVLSTDAAFANAVLRHFSLYEPDGFSQVLVSTVLFWAPFDVTACLQTLNTIMAASASLAGGGAHGTGVSSRDC